MTHPPTARPGWYADPEGTGNQRYWDGAQWTKHMVRPVARIVQTPALPSDVRVNTPFIWVIVLMPVVSMLTQSQSQMFDRLTTVAIYATVVVLGY